GGTALAIYACGACGQKSVTGGASGAGGRAASSGIIASSTLQSSSTATASGSGAGSGGGGCWPVDPPASIPKGWAEFSEWSCQCRFYYPPDPKNMVPAINWVACPEAPNGINCRTMKVDWTTKFAAVAVDASWDRMADGTEIVQFRRNVAPDMAL